MAQIRRLLATFGTGSFGRLGLGPNEKSAWVPTVVSSLLAHDIAEVVCGACHTAVLTDEGNLFTFGLNDEGQLGHSGGFDKVPVPVEVKLQDPIVAVAAGDYHTLALTHSGEVWAWGSNDKGQLGIGDSIHELPATPRRLKTLTGAGVVALAAGSEHSLALLRTGEVLSWGSSVQGALGHKPVGRQLPPIEWYPRLVAGLERVQRINAGAYASTATDNLGGCYTWGWGFHGQLGHGTRDDPRNRKQDPMYQPTMLDYVTIHRDNNEFTPRMVQHLHSMHSVSMGFYHCLGLSCNGTVWVWGTDEQGSLGQNDWTQGMITIPRALGSLPLCRSVAAGWKHSAAVSQLGQLMTWGWSGALGAGGFLPMIDRQLDYGGGQLGLADDRDRQVPSLVTRLQVTRTRFWDLHSPHYPVWQALMVSCGRNHTAAIIQVQVEPQELQAWQQAAGN